MRRPLLVSLITLGLLVLAEPATAETTIDPNGSVVKITIPVDVVGARGKTGPDGTTPLVDYWQQIVNDTWGAAFNTLPYKNCYRFELKLDLTARGDDFDATTGRHRIIVSAPTGGLTFDGTGFDGTRETSRNRTTGDDTGSFENDRDGAIPVDAARTVVAHEFGHLMGLGDDRENGRPKNGRDGTMMVGGVPGVDVNVVQRIDRQLITRMGETIERYLKDQGKDPLEPCEAWNGPMTTSYTASIAGVMCTAEENGTVKLAVVDGKVSGTIDTSGSETCTGAGSTITEPTAIVMQLAGTLENGEFRLDVRDVTGDHSLTPSCFTQATIDIPVERGTGQAEFTSNLVPGYTTTCNITVERQTNDERVG